MLKCIVNNKRKTYFLFRQETKDVADRGGVGEGGDGELHRGRLRPRREAAVGKVQDQARQGQRRISARVFRAAEGTFGCFIF